MTITADIDTAIDEAQARGVGVMAMTLRMGAGAMNALAADEGIDPLSPAPLMYRDIPIEMVDPPQSPWHSTSRHFHGWELIA